MTLLERLRHVQHFGRSGLGMRDLVRDAADEIDRLTAENQDLKDAFSKDQDRIVRLNNELAVTQRLRNEEYAQLQSGIKAIDRLNTMKQELAEARELADAIGQVDLYKERIQQLYASHARKDVELARLRVEVEAWRSGRIYRCHGIFVGLDGRGAITIDDAVDALIAEDAQNQTETQDNGEHEQGRR